MLRTAVVMILTSLSLGGAVAQVMQQRDDALQQQLLPESFRLTASAVSRGQGYWGRTSVTYALVNNTGMNLHIGVQPGSLSIGSCNFPEATNGGLHTVPESVNGGVAQPVLAPAGGRIAGTIVFLDCAAPNPGEPTAQLSMTLLLGRSAQIRTMTPFAVAAEAPVRRVTPD